MPGALPAGAGVGLKLKPSYFIRIDATNFSDFPLQLRGFLACPVGVLHRGAEAEADDPGRAGPHLVFRPVHGVLVLLAPPTLHPPRRSADAGGSASGDRTPSTLTSLGVELRGAPTPRTDTVYGQKKKGTPVETSGKQMSFIMNVHPKNKHYSSPKTL